MNKQRALYLHRELGLLALDIAELLGIHPQQIRIWLSE